MEVVRISWLKDHRAVMHFEVPLEDEETAWSVFRRLSSTLKAAVPGDWPRREWGNIPSGKSC